MIYRYSKLDDNEGLDGGPRFEIDDHHNFTICVVDEEDTARLFTAAADLLEAGQAALDYLTDHAIDLEGEPEQFLARIRIDLADAIAKAKGGAA